MRDRAARILLFFATIGLTVGLYACASAPPAKSGSTAGPTDPSSPNGQTKADSGAKTSSVPDSASDAMSEARKNSEAIAELNRKLLGQQSPPAQEGDLTLGAGDLV